MSVLKTRKLSKAVGFLFGCILVREVSAKFMARSEIGPANTSNNEIDVMLLLDFDDTIFPTKWLDKAWTDIDARLNRGGAKDRSAEKLSKKIEEEKVVKKIVDEWKNYLKRYFDAIIQGMPKEYSGQKLNFQLHVVSLASGDGMTREDENKEGGYKAKPELAIRRDFCKQFVTETRAAMSTSECSELTGAPASIKITRENISTEISTARDVASPQVHAFFPSSDFRNEEKGKTFKQQVFQHLLNNAASSLAARSAGMSSHSESAHEKPQLLVLAIGDNDETEGKALDAIELPDEAYRSKMVLKKMFVPIGRALQKERDGGEQKSFCQSVSSLLKTQFGNDDHLNPTQRRYINHLESRWDEISGEDGLQKWIPSLLEAEERSETFTEEKDFTEQKDVVCSCQNHIQ